MYKVLFFIFFTCWGVEASQYPLIYDVKTSACAAGCMISATYSQQLVEMGGMVDQKVDAGHRIVTIGTKQTKKDSSGVPHDYFYPVNMDSKLAASTDETYAEAAVRLYNTPMAQWNSTGLQQNVSTACIAYVFIEQVSGYTSWDNVIAPGGCTPVPPSYDWCELNMPAIFLDHGTLGKGAANGNSTSKNIGVACVAPTAVVFSLVQEQNYIDLEPSGRAEIEVDNKPLGTEIDLPEGDSTLSVKSTLSGITAAGVNTGSNVLVMMPY